MNNDNRITIFIFGLLVGAILMMFMLSFVNHANAVELPISGYNLKLKTDGDDVILSYFKNDSKDIMVYDLKRNTNEKVPGSENRDNRYWLYQGLGVGNNRIAVSWCVGNHSIYYAEKQIGYSFSNYECIHSGTGQPDTNRTDIAISPNEVMVVIQSDSKVFSMRKPHGGNWESPLVVYSDSAISEPTHPTICYYKKENIFYAGVTCSCGNGTGTRKKSVEIRRLLDNWTKLAGYDIIGAPDALGFAIDKDGSAYFSSSDWHSDEDGFCNLTVGNVEWQFMSWVTNKWDVMQETFGSYDPENPTHYHQPNTSIAVDDKGNMLVAYCHFWQVDDWTQTESYIHKYHEGEWSKPIKKGDTADIAVTYMDNEKVFYLCYVKGGKIHYETIIIDQDTTPTPTATEIFTIKPTPTGTEIPTLKPTPTGTYIPTLKPTQTGTYIPTIKPTVTPTTKCPQYECRGNFQGWQCCKRTDFAMFTLLLCCLHGYSRKLKNKK